MLKDISAGGKLLMWGAWSYRNKKAAVLHFTYEKQKAITLQ